MSKVGIDDFMCGTRNFTFNAMPKANVTAICDLNLDLLRTCWKQHQAPQYFTKLRKLDRWE